MEVLEMSDSNKDFSMFLGRFQPFHQGHQAIIQKLLDEGKNVYIAIRNTPKDENNPYSYEERWQMIREKFDKEWQEGRIIITKVPNIKEVVHGRLTGYNIREVKLSPELESISGTSIRNQLKNERSLEAN